MRSDSSIQILGVRKTPIHITCRANRYGNPKIYPRTNVFYFLCWHVCIEPTKITISGPVTKLPKYAPFRGCDSQAVTSTAVKYIYMSINK